MIPPSAKSLLRFFLGLENGIESIHVITDYIYSSVIGGACI
jgi:hypothetical protein